MGEPSGPTLLFQIAAT
ncbi:DUF6053 domain-containing protein [Lysobacter enzymogenes]